MEYIVYGIIAFSIYYLIRRSRKKKCSRCAFVFLLAFMSAYAQDTEKPFIVEHEKHLHKVDFVNATVFQQIRDYSAIYNTSHVFFSINPSDTDHLFF
ncbi:MAG: hypothetical protein Q9M89_00770, partial [Persephonella sp.]|nr:hypothetical protein [Persephonella sp.]